MISVGIDLVEISRIEKSIKNNNFLNKILGENEYRQLKERNFPANSIAANFCAKEAFIKCIGAIYDGFKFSDIELLRDGQGRPYIELNGRAGELFKENYKFSVSVTHTKEYASCVIIMTSKEGL